ncbi:hypothetical protein HMPREF2609_06185 [Rothia sp. HMSC058E10]|uniref:hypothetical protein n=1 Tax=Rothia sp. HMSC058E10 TaxID=1715088 RepID=UPI0008A4DD2F|nr:hypothetical protein [Rothia sp. HMSC058E10]OFN17478.1 hypothetical protein HMPREF2609_06185 [Rothia sp. HMSC058E10]
MPPALIGLLAGLFVRNVPSLKRTMGQPVLGVKQHRPKLAFIAGYVLLVGGLVAAPIYVTIKYGDPIASFILAFVICGPLVIPFVNHCHAFYIQQTLSGVYWRNWRWKIRYMPYESISEVLLQSNGKNGYLRVRSRNIKRVRLSFDPWQFDASILFAMVLSRVEHQEWPQDLNAQRVEELVSGFGSYEKMFERIKRLTYERKLKLD